MPRTSLVRVEFIILLHFSQAVIGSRDACRFATDDETPDRYTKCQERRSYTTPMKVPFFRVNISQAGVDEVVACLQSGWLTTGPNVRTFETRFVDAVRASNGIAVNSCTAAMHLAVESLKLRPGTAVLVPAMTFAATAEVVRYQGAIPILVDCESDSHNISIDDAERKLHELRSGELPVNRDMDVCGIIPVHVAGLMVDMDRIRSFAEQHGLWIVEDAAHAFPAAFRADAHSPWRCAGENTADVTCFSFYANKTITTGEGGMAVTGDDRLAERMRCMALHGLTNDAWSRFETGASWDYRIVAPGFKYNMTDIAAAIGIHQLARAEKMRRARERVAGFYFQRLAGIAEIELPPKAKNRVHAWHLFAIRLHPEKLRIDRNAFIKELNARGVGTSVHWRPLHLHPYYQNTFGWRDDHCPVASRQWKRLISLPIFPDIRQDELEYVADQLEAVCRQWAVYRWI